MVISYSVIGGGWRNFALALYVKAFCTVALLIHLSLENVFIYFLESFCDCNCFLRFARLVTGVAVLLVSQVDGTITPPTRTYSQLLL